MATEQWLKLRKTLLRSPKIHQLAAALGTTVGEAFYLALLWLDYLDEYTENGHTNVTPQFLETYFSQPHFYTALREIGWIDADENGHVFALDYSKHNGQNAKKRLQDAERKAKSRTSKVTKKSQKSHTEVTPVSQKSHENVTLRERERERNIYIQNSTLKQRSNTPPRTVNHHRQNDCNANRRYDL